MTSTLDYIPIELSLYLLLGACLFLLRGGFLRARAKQTKIDNRVRDVRFAARLAAVEARTVLRRSEEIAAELIRAAENAQQIHDLLRAGILFVPARVSGERGYGDDAALVATHARVFDHDLVAELMRQRAWKELSVNSFLPTTLIDPLVWYLAGQYPSIGLGCNTNMARQSARHALKRIVAQHGLDASHPIAQKLLAHAVGDSAAPQHLDPGHYSGAMQPSHLLQLLHLFDRWPHDWAPRLAAAAARRQAAAGEPVESAGKHVSQEDRTVLGWILVLVYWVPAFALIIVGYVARMAWSMLTWPLREES